jgi:N-acetylglucosamine-6-phosphate deacetylase
MMQALHDGRILTNAGFRDDLVVLVEDGFIADLVAYDDPRIPQAESVNLQGNTLLPGFIDWQVNGGGGVLFNDAPSVDTLRRIGLAHLRFGTTGFLPTLISDDADTMRAAISAVDDAITQGIPGVLGIHLEGPYIAPARRGAHDATKFRQLDDDEINLVCSLRGGVTVLTLAPECVTPEQIRTLVARGIIVCAGHSAASYEQVRSALDAGLRGFTHLYNAMSPLQGREPGMVGAALEDTRSWCGMIVDGQHAHPASLRVAIAAKSFSKMTLVTDAMPPVGAETDTYVLAGATITCRNGRCETADGVLAGSALDMATAVRNSVNTLGIGFEDAARMASTWPAEFLGLANQRGSIARGQLADLVLVDAEIRVLRTWRAASV